MRHHKANVSFGRSIKNIYICMYISENVGKGKEHTRENAKCRGSPIATGKLSLVWEPNRPIPPTSNSRSFSPGPACVPCLLGSIHGKCCKYVLKYAFIHTNMARRRLRQPQKASASAVESSWSRSRQNNKIKL